MTEGQGRIDRRAIAPVLDGTELQGEFQLPQNTLGLVPFAHGSGSSRPSPRNRFVADVLFEASAGGISTPARGPRRR